jgi:hypothetical protein
MKHSATLTYLVMQKHTFDGGRTWNARLRDGGISATDFKSEWRGAVIAI